jgi:DsbC/DsbD-like thiol-disulfide interchange protein
MPKILRRLPLVAILPMVAILAESGELAAQGKKSDAVVKVTATADKPDADGKQTVTITMVTDKGWHNYANPVGNKDLVDAQTVVNVSAKQPVEVVKIAYPPGALKKDPKAGNYMIYEGITVIKAQVKRTKGDTSPLDVSVSLQSCDKESCLFPATVKISVP